MQRNFKIFMLIISIVLLGNIQCFGLNNEGNKEVWRENNVTNNMTIETLDVNIKKEEININEKYLASAVVTLKITNKGIYDIELANIDIMPYQGDKPAKYFVSTSKENITGFIGNLRSQESKIIKIGVALHNLEQPVKLEMNNIYDSFGKKETLKINI